MNPDKSLRQIDDELPNGFHDAILQTIVLDLVSNSAKLTLELLVGEPDAASEAERELYKGATLTLEGLVYFVIDTPGAETESSKPEGVRIDAGDATSRNPGSPAPRRPLPPGSFAYWFFLEDWNGFIHVAARRATLQWEQCNK